jgi:hypothetical protein
MARLSSLSYLSFTPAAGSVPTTTQVATTITNFYKLSYSYIYGPGKYSTDESTDAKTIIDSDEFRAELDAELSPLVEQWSKAGTSSDGVLVPIPTFTLSEKFKKILNQLIIQKVGRFENIRLWNEDQDWLTPGRVSL